MPELQHRPMVCECGSTRIVTQKDVGFDIDPEGEETQHLDECLDCGMTRLWVERWVFGTSMYAATSPHIHCGKWRKNKFGYPA